jgi:hypothetical protein
MVKQPALTRSIRVQFPVDLPMASFKTFKTTTSKMVCRGGEKACIGQPDLGHRTHKRLIPKGSKVLEVSVYGAGGGQTAYYCEVCTLAIIERMEKLIEEVKRGHDVNGSIVGS